MDNRVSEPSKAAKVVDGPSMFSLSACLGEFDVIVHSNRHRWYKKHPLHLSSLPAVSSQDHSSSSLSNRPSVPRGSTASQRSGKEIPSDAPISESYFDSLPPEQPQSSFTTALAMLLYDVSYLAWTQNVEVPLSQVGDVLSNLWSVCCSSDLGRFVHPFIFSR